MIITNLIDCLPSAKGVPGPVSVIVFNDNTKQLGYVTGIVSAQIEFNGKWINKSAIKEVHNSK